MTKTNRSSASSSVFFCKLHFVSHSIQWHCADTKNTIYVTKQKNHFTSKHQIDLISVLRFPVNCVNVSTCIRVYVCAPAVSILFSKFVLSNVSPMNWLATAKNGYIYVIRQTTLFHFPSNRMNDNLVRLRWSTGRFFYITDPYRLTCLCLTNTQFHSIHISCCILVQLHHCPSAPNQLLNHWTDWERERYREWEGRWLMVMRESSRPIFVVVVVVQCSTVYMEKEGKRELKF